MDFRLGQDKQDLQKRVSGFCTEHCPPSVATALEQSGEFPADLYAAMAEAGLLKMCLPQQLGGAGGGVLDAVLITETLARTCNTAVNMLLVNAVFSGTTLLVGGTDEQKAEFLPDLGTGKLKFAFALTEPQAGSDASGIEATAVQDGNDFLINGTKLYTTGATVADYIITIVRTNSEKKASKGSSIFVVPHDTAGVGVRGLNKIAGNAFASCEVRYSDARVAASFLLGGEAGLDHAWNTLMHTGAMERICVAASCLGLAQTIFEEARQFAVSRQQFGQPIAKFQAIQHALVDMATEIEAMRQLTSSAASMADRGETAAKEISMAKYYCSEKVNAMAMQGMKILGGRAYLEDTPMARYLREGILSFYAGGTTEIQKNLIAKFLGL